MAYPAQSLVPAEVHVKATPVNSLVEFVRRELTPEQFKQVIDRFDPADQRILSGHLLAHEQVSVTTVNAFNAYAAEVKGEPVKSFAYRAGRSSAEAGLKSVYKFMMMLMSIESVLSKAPFMWARVYDGGTMKVESTDRSAKIHIRDFPSHPASCGRITGWFEVIGERAGAKNLKLTHNICMAQGGPECCWDFAWDK